MKVSCCVFDLDGTLLTSDNTISDIDKETLRKLSRDGVKIIIATGRTELQILQYVNDLGISDPAITCNGGHIINTNTGEVLFRKFLLPKDVKRILDAAEAENLDYLFYTPDYVYHSYSSKRIKLFLSYNDMVRDEFKVPIRKASDYPRELNYSNVIKILIHDDTSRIPEFEQRFNENKTLTLVTSGYKCIEFMAENISKGNGLKQLAEALNIPISEIVAFGDGLNDETMLRSAGYSVAMGNAADEIKSICDFVTKTNDEHGITYALNHIINASIKNRGNVVIQLMGDK